MNQNEIPRRPGRGNGSNASRGGRSNHHYKQTTPGGQPVFRADNKVIGYISGDTLYQTRKPEHFLRIPPAIAFDKVVFLQMELAGADKIVVTQEGTGSIYRASLQQFRVKGFPVKRGGDQVGLVLSEWAVSRPGNLSGTQSALF